MSNRKINRNLFRFATLRNPSILTQEQKECGFIFPNATEKKAVAAIENAPLAEKAAKRAAFVSSFTALAKKAEVRDLDSGLHDLGDSLARGTFELTFDDIYVRLKAFKPLTATVKTLIWRNLYYQHFTNKNRYVREALIKLLVANNFVAKVAKYKRVNAADDARFLLRISKAAVVLPNGVAYEAPPASTAPSATTTSPAVRELARQAEAAAARDEVEAIELLISELEVYESEYFNQSVPTRNVERNTDIPTGTGVGVDVDVVPILPNPWNAKILFTKLSTASYQKLFEIGVNEQETIRQGITRLRGVASKLNANFFDKVGLSNKTAVVNGTLIKTDKVSNGRYQYAISTKNGKTGVRNARISVNVGYPNARIIESSFGITHDGTKRNGSAVKSILTNGNYISFALEESDFVLPVMKSNTFNIQGSLILDNGVKLDINQNVNSTSGNHTVTGHTGVELPGGVSTSTPKEIEVYGVNRIGITDFRRVEQELCCYVPGEVSHIENIMAREYKERSSRRYSSTETNTETTNEKEVEQLTDTSTTERNELSSEVSEVLNEDQSRNYGGSAYFGYSAGPLSVGADAYFDSASSTSSSVSDAQSVSYAKDVTERALERIVQKVTTKRSSTIIRQYEEQNKHGFDNTEGNEHVTGVYRWVDKIYKNKLVNYGKRLTYEFSIPEPAKFLRYAIENQIEVDNSGPDVILPPEPQHPASFGFYGPQSINRSNYQSFAAKYKANVKAPMDETVTITDSYAEEPAGASVARSYSELQIDENYRASYYKLRARYSRVPDSNAQITMGIFDDIEQSTYMTGTVYTDVKTVPISFQSLRVNTIHIHAQVVCKLRDEVYKNWQNETYSAIMGAYQDRINAYNDAKIAAGVATSTISSEKVLINPAFNRQIEQKELKRACLELMLGQTGYDLGRENFVTPIAGIPQIKADKEFDDYGKVVRFFEQAFDWNIMSYIFYPYFWANPDEWKNLFQEQDGGDPLFQAFLQSGFSRVMLPVRQGFEETVLYYLQTGKIWGGEGLVFDSDNELYLSIAEELQTPDGEVEETWETRVPSMLNIIQAKSAPLDEEGLPCYCEDDDTRIGKGASLLVGEDGIPVGAEGTLISDVQPIYTAIYDEEDAVDDGIDEFRFKIFNRAGKIILSGNRSYDTEQDAIQALNYTIFTILDDTATNVNHTAGDDNKWSFNIIDFNDVNLARRIEKFDTEADSIAAADALVAFLQDITG